jgi:hypothetical protein
MSLTTEALALSLLLEESLEAGLLLGNLLRAQNLLHLGVLRLRLGLALLDKGRELVLVGLLARLAVVHLKLLGGNDIYAGHVNQFFTIAT